MTLLPSHPSSLAAFTLPTKEVIYLEPSEFSRVDAVLGLTEAIGRGRGNGRIFFANGWCGSGYYHYLSPPPPIRNLFLIPHGFRPYDDRELVSRLDGISAFMWDKAVDRNRSWEASSRRVPCPRSWRNSGSRSPIRDRRNS